VIKPESCFRYILFSEIYWALLITYLIFLVVFAMKFLGVDEL